MLAALRYPFIVAPLLLVFLRYRILGSHVLSARLPDGVDFDAEAWRLSGYLTALIVFVAYPAVLSDYDDWLWSAHTSMTVGFLAFWLSSAAWVVARHFQLKNLTDEKLFKDLAAISEGVPVTRGIRTPGWLRAWGVVNAVAFAGLIVASLLLVRTLR